MVAVVRAESENWGLYIVSIEMETSDVVRFAHHCGRAFDLTVLKSVSYECLQFNSINGMDSIIKVKDLRI